MKKFYLRYWYVLYAAAFAIGFYLLFGLLGSSSNIYINGEKVAAANNHAAAEEAIHYARMRLYGMDDRLVSDINPQIEDRRFSWKTQEGAALKEQVFHKMEMLANARSADACCLQIGKTNLILKDLQEVREVLQEISRYYCMQIDSGCKKGMIFSDFSLASPETKYQKVRIIYCSAVSQDITSKEEAIRDIIEKVTQGDLIFSFTASYTRELTEDIPSIVRELPGEYTDYKQCVENGKAGVWEETRGIRYENGIPVEDKSLGKTEIQAAIPAVWECGIRERPSFLWPISGRRITSAFGERWGRNHEGVDIGVVVGTDVHAAQEGTVTKAEYYGTYGNCVIISHVDGHETRYAHLSEILVEEGDRVAKGDLIAKTGNTGRSTGPHLHFEIRRDGEARNPLEYFTGEKFE